MSGFPENPQPVEQPVQQPPEGVQEIPTKMEIPAHLEQGKSGVKTAPTNFTAQVTDDSGQQLIQTPATQQVSVTIPGNITDENLDKWREQNVEESKTWWIAFFDRVVKQAKFFGRNIVKGGNDNAK